ncbi:hypothetical protein [Massilia sp. Se16.2.3]|uniref:hypothetical protein n=1 Tax=Massilia sp. Se16.2.3 TaxID=2709303 RepID=UPI001E636E71|nr:hypothetical protein [Massilia sp. Se16.2.3]
MVTLCCRAISSLTAQAPMSASSLPPAEPAATRTHLMFQPVCVPPPAPHTPAVFGWAFVTGRCEPP